MFERLKNSSLLFILLLLVLALVGIVIELDLTTGGPGVSGDAVVYMDGARNLVEGKGYSRLKGDGSAVAITHFPPAFPAVLAAFYRLGVPVIDAGRWLNAFLLGVNIFLIGILAYMATRSSLLALLAASLALFAENVLRIHAWVMAEPLYLFLSLLTFVALLAYLKKPRWVWLIALGLLIGFAILTRYVGMALLPVVCLGMLLFGQKPARQRWVDAIGVGVIGLIPFMFWLWRNGRVVGSTTNRTLAYHPMSSELVQALFDELAFWWLPLTKYLPLFWRYSFWGLFVLVSAGICVYALLLLKKEERLDAGESLAGILALYACFYFLLLFVNTTFLDASTDVAGLQRYVVPWFVLGNIWAISVYLLLSRLGLNKTLVVGGVLLVGLGIWAMYAYKSVRFVQQPGFAFGYTDTRREWQCEVDALQSLGPERSLVTNDYELVYFLAERPPYAMAMKYDNLKDAAFADYAEQRVFVQDLITDGAVLVATGDPDQYGSEIDGLVSDMGLKVLLDCSHARFYGVKP